MRDFEPDQLSISVVDEGFILGVSPLGTVLGLDSALELDVTDQLRSLQISHPRDVVDDLFIAPQTATCALTAVFQDAPAVLKNRTLVVRYTGQSGELFRGRVIQATRSVQMDTSSPDVYAWSVSLTATQTEERAVRYRIAAPSASQTDPVTAILERLPYISEVQVSAGVNLSGVLIAAGHEDSMTAREFLTRVEKITSSQITPDPTKPSRLLMRPYNYGSTWTLSDQQRPSFTGITFTESLDAATGVTVTPTFKPSGAGTDLSVTRSLPGAVRNDVEVSVDVPYTLGDLLLAAGKMPIRRGQPEYVKQIMLPFDGLLDASDIPTAAVAWLQGQRHDVAVLSVTHAIEANPPQWRITLDCAPVHLLTRESQA